MGAYTETVLTQAGARSATFVPTVSDALDTHGGHACAQPNVRFYSRVTAASGTTPSLTINVYGVAEDGQLYLVGSFAAITAAGNYTQKLDSLPRRIAIGWTVTGTTPSFTFDVRCGR